MEQEVMSQPQTSEPLKPLESPSRYELRTVKKCGARCKSTGKPCLQPAMPNGRCRVHGGKSPGAPKGNRNAWKHGRYSVEHEALRRRMRELLREMKELTKITGE